MNHFLKWLSDVSSVSSSIDQVLSINRSMPYCTNCQLSNPHAIYSSHFSIASLTFLFPFSFIFFFTRGYSYGIPKSHVFYKLIYSLVSSTPIERKFRPLPKGKGSCTEAEGMEWAMYGAQASHYEMKKYRPWGLHAFKLSEKEFF